MSLEYINRAYRVHVGNPTAKFVLIVIADHVDQGGVGWVAVSRIVAITELSERAVRTAIGKLTAMRLMETNLHGGKYRTNSFKLTLPEAGEKPADGAAGAGMAGQTVQQVQGAAGAGVQQVQGGGAAGAGGVVQQVQGGGAAGAPYPSYIQNDIRPKPEGPAGCLDLEFPQDFPELMRGAMTAWWRFKEGRGQGYGPGGWRGLCRLAAKHTLEEVTSCVAVAIREEWNGLYFRQKARDQGLAPASDGLISTGNAGIREKKRGGAGFGMRGVEPAGFPWEAFTFLEKGYTPTVPWHEQTPRFRSDLKVLWAKLSPERRAEVEARAKVLNFDGEKREAAA